MSAISMNVLKEDVQYDDSTLVSLYNNSFRNFQSKKNNFSKKLKSSDKNDYLSFTLARLAYEFAKEEYDTLSYEAKKRGLIV